MARVFRKWHKVNGELKMHYRPAKERQGIRKKIYNAFRTYLLATLDTQMLLTFAYGLNFWLVQKCTISVYHYALVIDIGLISCANFILTIAFVGEYWKAPITSTLRFIVMLVIFSFLGYMVIHQRNQIENPEYRPSLSRKDSTVLLPASCFLDRQFKNIYSSLDISVRQKIGFSMKPYQSWEFLEWILIGFGLAFGFVRVIMQYLTDRQGKTKTYRLWKGIFICSYKIAALVLFILVSLASWIHIYSLKQWVRRSGWIKPGRILNPEYDWLENGQILPMLQLVMILVYIFNEFEY